HSKIVSLDQDFHHKDTRKLMETTQRNTWTQNAGLDFSVASGFHNFSFVLGVQYEVRSNKKVYKYRVDEMMFRDQDNRILLYFPNWDTSNYKQPLTQNFRSQKAIQIPIYLRKVMGLGNGWSLNLEIGSIYQKVLSRGGQYIDLDRLELVQVTEVQDNKPSWAYLGGIFISKEINKSFGITAGYRMRSIKESFQLQYGEIKQRTNSNQLEFRVYKKF